MRDPPARLMEMMTLDTPIISILIGEGGSGGALALAVADRVCMMENTVYSVISPEGCASILWKDAAKAEIAAKNLKLTADDALTLGITERIIEENEIGKDPFCASIRASLSAQLRELEECGDLPGLRYERFRRIGAPTSEKEEDQ